MTKPSLDNLESNSIKNLLDLLYHQKKHSRQDDSIRQRNYDIQIEGYEKRYFEITGHYYFAQETDAKSSPSRGTFFPSSRPETYIQEKKALGGAAAFEDRSIRLPSAPDNYSQDQRGVFTD